MNLIRAAVLFVASVVWWVFGATLGAASAVMSLVLYIVHATRDEPSKAGDALAGGVIFVAPVGFLAGLLCAVYLWARWLRGKSEPGCG